jgi:hypothetical protein
VDEGCGEHLLPHGEALAVNLDVFDETNGFITKWTVSGDATARTITLPLVQNRNEGALAYNCTVDWGDGSALSTVTSYNDANRIHTYAGNGTYNVEIRGTCEGWSFNNTGDKLKIVGVVYWGDAGGFNGFKYLANAFYGCANLTSLGVGVILPSGTGIGTNGFNTSFGNCTSLTTIPVDLFKYNTLVAGGAFNAVFSGCTGLATIPLDLFRYNTAVSSAGFANAFADCTSLTAIPTDLFRYNTSVSTSGFSRTFAGCSSLTSIPTDLFRYNTLAATTSFSNTFNGCTSLSSIPTDLFRYNTGVNQFANTFNSCTSLITIPTDLFRYNTAVNSFSNCFTGCNSLTTIPTDLFRYNVLVADFFQTFSGCSLLNSVPAELFRYNTSCTDFRFVFNNCNSLQLLSTIFYNAGEQTTRFLNKSVDFTSSFARSSFSGIQGTAPDLWNCSFGTGTPTTALCFGGTGNSLTSLSNYGAIPVAWRT